MSTSEIDKLREHFGIDYDASEVRRWWIEDNEANRDVPAEVARPRYVEVIAIEDHDRIIAERDELWKRATEFVMPGEMDTGESIEHYIKTLEQAIARQARVIENLKDVVTCVGCDANEWCPYAWDGYNTNGDCLADK